MNFSKGNQHAKIHKLLPWRYLEDRGKVSYHLIVLLRLGWLTVLSSMNIVEQELYFLDRSPGDICERRHDSLKKKKKKRHMTAEIPRISSTKPHLNTYMIQVVAFPFLAHCNGWKRIRSGDEKNTELGGGERVNTDRLSATCSGRGCWLSGGPMGWPLGPVL